MCGFDGSFFKKRTTGLEQGLNTFCKDICTWMKVAIGEGASSGGGIIYAQLLQSETLWAAVPREESVEEKSVGYTTFPS